MVALYYYTVWTKVDRSVGTPSSVRLRHQLLAPVAESDSREVADFRARMAPASGFSSLDQPRTGAGGMEEEGWAEPRGCRRPTPDRIA